MDDYTTPVHGLLFNKSQDANYPEMLNQMSAMLNKAVAFGTHIINWQCESAIAANNAEHLSTSYMFIRHLTEQLDSISQLVLAGVSSPCQIILRAMIETNLGITYLYQDDSKNRAMAYQVSNIHKQINFNQKIDPATPQGKELRAVLNRDTSGFTIPKPSIDPSKRIEKLTELLAREELVPIEQEWQRTKEKKNGRVPKWYSLFDGPDNINNLADHLNRTAWYQILYRQFSSEVHAEDCVNAVVRWPEQKKSIIRPIRYPEGLETLVGHSLTTGIDAFNTVIASDFPERLTDFASWYVKHIRKGYLAVTGKKLISVEFTT